MRPRHCDGRLHTTLNTPLICKDREGECCGPEPGDDPRSFSDEDPRGGARATWLRLFVSDVARARASSRGRGRLLYFPHPRYRRRALWCVGISLCGVLACQRTADQSTPQSFDSAHADSTIVAVDDFGAPLPVDGSYSTRVVSLNPTATEVIFAIGADAQLVGRSKWDAFPKEAAGIPAVGDGIRPNVEAVLHARPTLVILYATSENRAAARTLADAGIRTIAMRVDHIAQFVALTRALGVALNQPVRAAAVADSVTATLTRVRTVTQHAAKRTVAWPLWQSPVMVVGQGSYLDELIEIAGGTNVFHDLESPSPPVNIEEIAKRNPDVLVASSATIAELRAKPQWRAVRAVRDSVFVTDNPDLTGRPSVVLGMAAVMLARALHPELASQLPTLPTPAASAKSPR